jgi:hypothetical protein
LWNGREQAQHQLLKSERMQRNEREKAQLAYFLHHKRVEY